MQLLDVLDEVTEELQCEENAEVDSVEEVQKHAEEIPGVLPMTDEMLAARSVFHQWNWRLEQRGVCESSYY